MKVRFIMTILAAVFSVGTSIGQGPGLIEPGRVYQWQGLTVMSPDEPGWTLATSDGTRIVFERRNDQEILQASVSFIKTKVYETDADLFAGLEPLKEEEWKALKVDHLHFNSMGAKGGGGPFLQYDAIFNLDDTVAPGFRYLNLRGRLYPHPYNKGQVVQVEFSVRSSVRGFLEDQLSLVEEFLAKAVVPKSAAKPV